MSASQLHVFTLTEGECLTLLKRIGKATVLRTRNIHVHVFDNGEKIEMQDGAKVPVRSVMVHADTDTDAGFGAGFLTALYDSGS